MELRIVVPNLKNASVLIDCMLQAGTTANHMFRSRTLTKVQQLTAKPISKCFVATTVTGMLQMVEHS